MPHGHFRGEFRNLLSGSLQMLLQPPLDDDPAREAVTACRQKVPGTELSRLQPGPRGTAGRRRLPDPAPKHKRKKKAKWTEHKPPKGAEEPSAGA